MKKKRISSGSPFEGPIGFSRAIRIEKAIIQAGGKMEDVVRTRVYLTKADTWKEAGRAHGEYFGKIRPASTFVEVSRLIDPEWMVEIEAECEIDRQLPS